MLILTAILPWIQVVSAVLVVAGVLLQQSGEGLGSAFGDNTEGGFFRQKRGLEKQIFIATITVSIIFVITSILALFV